MIDTINLDIFPIISVPSFTCYENNIIAPVAKMLGEDVFVYFSTHFQIKYLRNNPDDLYHLSIYSGFKNEIIKKYYGISITTISCKDMRLEDFYKSIRKEKEQGKIVGVMTDAYNCPWNRKFLRKIHMEHYFLIGKVGDTKDSDIMCYDGFFSNDVEQIPFKQLYLLSKALILIEIDITQKANKKSISYYLYNGLTYCKSNYINVLKEFSMDIRNLNFQKELDKCNKDIAEADVILNIIKIEKARTNYFMALNNFEKQGVAKIPEDILSLLKNDIDFWEQAKGRVIQALLNQRKSSLNKAADIFCKIGSTEEEICDKLSVFLKSD